MSLVEIGQRIWDRHFGEDEAEVERVRQQEIGKLAWMEEYVGTQGFRETKEWLGAALERYETQPGSHESMLHSVGVRAGLRLVQQHLAAIEGEVRRSRNV